MAHPQAVALAEPCPHEIRHQQSSQQATLRTCVCVCERAGVYTHSALEMAQLLPHRGAVEGPDLIELGGEKTLGLGGLGHVFCD